jgi:hypothetical protein
MIRPVPHQDALAQKKLLVTWDVPDDDGAPPRDALLAAVWAALRQQHRAPETSQDEQVEVRSVAPGSEPDTFRLAFRYVFDRDFASQYDQRETFDAELVVDRTGALVSITAWLEQPPA